MATLQMVDSGQEIRVLLIDDNPVFLQTATGFLERHGRAFALQTSGSVEAALSRAAEFNPGVIVFDPSGSGSAGLDIVSGLRRDFPGARVIAMALVDSMTYHHACLAAGADGFVSKSDLVSGLLPAILGTVPAGPTGCRYGC